MSCTLWTFFREFKKLKHLNAEYSFFYVCLSIRFKNRFSSRMVTSLNDKTVPEFVFSFQFPHSIRIRTWHMLGTLQRCWRFLSIESRTRLARLNKTPKKNNCQTFWTQLFNLLIWLYRTAVGCWQLFRKGKLSKQRELCSMNSCSKGREKAVVQFGSIKQRQRRHFNSIIQFLNLSGGINQFHWHLIEPYCVYI